MKTFVNSPTFVTRHGGTFGGLGYASASVVDKGTAEWSLATSSETRLLQIFALDPKNQGCTPTEPPGMLGAGACSPPVGEVFFLKPGQPGSLLP